jgi:plasmid maintenance system killer protein
MVGKFQRQKASVGFWSPRQGQFSIRVNDQWRICFVWRDNEAWDVEIVDYH